MIYPEHEREENTMAGEYTKTLTIDTVERMNNSVDDNPKYRVTFTSGLVAQTQTDSQIAYAIDNSEFRDVPVDVYFTKAGHIFDVRVTEAS